MKYFSFHKKEKPSFELREVQLEQIEMQGISKKNVCDKEGIQTGYEDPRWIEKSNSIKARDNYTCQLCHAFNPMLGDFIFMEQGKYSTLHHYYLTAGHSKYDIYVQKFDLLTISFEFSPNFHLAMPRLNVHHKIYYRNRDLWDYPDDCLVTLCEKCHQYIHTLNDLVIPIVEEKADGQTILIGKTRPIPYIPKFDHTDLGTFQPLALVEENRWGIGLKEQDWADYQRAKRENKHWYDYHETLDDKVVHIQSFMCDNPQSKHTKEEIDTAIEYIKHDFIENILGFSKIKK